MSYSSGIAECSSRGISGVATKSMDLEGVDSVPFRLSPGSLQPICKWCAATTTCTCGWVMCQAVGMDVEMWKNPPIYDSNPSWWIASCRLGVCWPNLSLIFYFEIIAGTHGVGVKTFQASPTFKYMLMICLHKQHRFLDIYQVLANTCAADGVLRYPVKPKHHVLLSKIFKGFLYLPTIFRQPPMVYFLGMWEQRIRDNFFFSVAATEMRLS